MPATTGSKNETPPATSEHDGSSGQNSHQNESVPTTGVTASSTAANTPASSQPKGPVSRHNAEEDLSPEQRNAVLAFFHKRGFKRAEDSLKAEIEALGNGVSLPQAMATVASRFGNSAVNLNDLAIKSAPREPLAGEKLNGSSNIDKASGIGPAEAAAVEALRLDPTDRSRGFGMLKHWTEGSLDIYQPELGPVLFPLFINAYLDLVEMGYGAAAAALYRAHSSTFLPQHSSQLSAVRAVTLPMHITADPVAWQFRTERYVVKMSSTVFSLLLGWLTDGRGPVAGGGAADGLGDGLESRERRAREAMLKILNDHCRVQILNAKASELDAAQIEEGSGLTGTVPSSSGPSTHSVLRPGVVSESDVVADFNASAAGPQLKLGSKIPLNEKLMAEVQRESESSDSGKAELQDQDKGTQQDSSPPRSARDETALVQPVFADLPPQPTFKDIDIQREVTKLRDARKALRFDLSLRPGDSSASVMSAPFLSGVRDPTFNGLGAEGATAAQTAAQPSVCAYTFHDADDGLTTTRFSPDLSLVAAGFEESYVQLWSTKREPLQGLRSDFKIGNVRDAASLNGKRDGSVLSTRKLIGHSGPIYGMSFDPLSGSIAPPRHLLSASADGTARLWSLKTYTALVSYRGHQQPLWDVEWSPMGVYFATASADRTARLWSTERINPLRMYAGHLSDVDCLSFHPNSLYLATGSSDRTCRLWDVQRGACVRLFVGSTGAVTYVKISPDGRLLASADECSFISLWDLASGRRVKKMWGHEGAIHALDFSVDGSLLVSSGADCTVRSWDVKSAGGPGADVKVSSDCVASFYTKKTPMLEVTFTPRNLCLVAGPYTQSM